MALAGSLQLACVEWGSPDFSVQIQGAESRLEGLIGRASMYLLSNQDTLLSIYRLTRIFLRMKGSTINNSAGETMNQNAPGHTELYDHHSF